MLENIAFKNYRKKDDIHGTVLYPAVMVAPIQKDILEDLISDMDIRSVFDPFHGSGTALYETMEIDNSMHLVGCDINPLAHLITKVKLQGVNKNIYSDYEYLKDMIDNPVDILPYDFTNIDKWFRSDIKEAIQIVRSAIISIEDDENRLFFWYMLSDIIRKYSNTRSSTYKLHIKQEEKITNMENRVIKDYVDSVNKNIPMFAKRSTNYILYKCDVLQKINQFPQGAFDVSITSPPYGDNATTVPYGQFSMLALYTIDKKDLELDGWELDNFSIIDNRSLGGANKELEINDFEMGLLNPYLNRISDGKKNKVLRFFNDYFCFMKELCRVTRKYIVLTLGNRTVDRVQIDLTNITRIFLENEGFSNIKCAVREIPAKRTPRTTSIVNRTPVSSMNYEYILIHEKNDEMV